MAWVYWIDVVAVRLYVDGIAIVEECVADIVIYVLFYCFIDSNDITVL